MEHHEHKDSLGASIKQAIHDEQSIVRAKAALKAIAKILKKHGVSAKTIIALVSSKPTGKKKIVKKHDGTFEVQDIDRADMLDIDNHDEEVGMVRDEEGDEIEI
jgi:hypothetical protein